MPQVDLYTAGFPCQPWSSAGKGEGRRDEQGRGLIFDHVLKYINEKLPKCFLLENVVALSHATHKKEFGKMLASLRRSEEYFVTWRVINVLNFGIPQNRPRVFIVGLLRSAVSQPSFPWPKPATRSPLPLTRFLCGGAGVIRPLPGAGTVASSQLQRGLEAIREEKGNPHTTDYSLDIWSGRDYPSRMTDRVPCITRTRGGAGGVLHHVRSALAHRGGNVELAGAPALLPGGGASGRCVGPAARHDGGERHRHQRPPGHFAEDVDPDRQAVSDEGGRADGGRAAVVADRQATGIHSLDGRTARADRSVRQHARAGHAVDARGAMDRASEWLKFEAPGGGEGA